MNFTCNLHLQQTVPLTVSNNSGCIHAIVSRIYSITADRLTQKFYMSTDISTYKYKGTTCFGLKIPSSAPTAQE
jgi:hypothetical protein